MTMTVIMAKTLGWADMNKENDNDVLANAKAYFERAQAYEAAQRTDELDDIRFVGLLQQWPEEIRRIREADPQGARPCLTVDKVNQYKNQIVNNIRMNSPSIKVRPVDDNADVEVAEVYQGIIRHIESESKADLAYDWASEGSVDSGLGFFRIVTEYIGSSFQQEIKIKKIPNRFSVYRDPDSYEIDGSDQKECLITEMVTRKAFKKMYPNANQCEWASSTGDTDTWITENELRLAEYFYCDYVKDELLLLESGDSVYLSEYEQRQEQLPIIDRRQAERKVIKWAKLSGNEVLEESEFAGSYIPIIPVFGIVTVVDGRMYWRGIVRGAKDPQRMYNYNRSTIAESLSLTIKAPFIGAVGQFKTASRRWQNANRVNYAYMEYDPVTTNGQLAPPPQRQGFAGVPSGLLQDIETSEHDIQAGLGMYQASIGQDSNAKSGRALNAQRQQGDVATFHFPDNLAKSVAHAGRIIVDIIPKYYDTQRVIRILGEDGSQEFAQLDPSQPEAMREMRTDNGIKKIYNLGVGKYDVIATSGASFASKREEGAEFITQLVQTSPDLMPIVGDLLFKAMDMPYADEISERLKKMMPPQLQEQPEGGESQEVQAVKQQAQQIIEQLNQQLQAAEQAMQEAEGEAQELAAKAENAQGKNEIEAAKLELDNKRVEIDAVRAETERLAVEKDKMQILASNPMLPQFMQDTEATAEMFKAMMDEIMQNKAMIEQIATDKNKTFELQGKNGVYRGAVIDGQIQIEAPSGQVYTGIVNEG